MQVLFTTLDVGSEVVPSTSNYADPGKPRVHRGFILYWYYGGLKRWESFAAGYGLGLGFTC